MLFGSSDRGVWSMRMRIPMIGIIVFIALISLTAISVAHASEQEVMSDASTDVASMSELSDSHVQLVDSLTDADSDTLSDLEGDELVQAVFLQLDEYQQQYKPKKKKKEKKNDSSKESKSSAVSPQSKKKRRLRVIAPASLRLSEDQHEEKFARFVKRNKRRYKNSAEAHTAYEKFKKSRAKIITLNDQYVDKSLKDKAQAQFRSDGPFADFSREEFMAKRANSINPFTRKPRGGKSASPKKNKKRSVSLLESSSEAGKSVAFRSGKRVVPKGGGAGNSATRSGTTGKASGTAEKKSGKIGGGSGTPEQKSGKIGGGSGTPEKKSGKIGGGSGDPETKSGKIGGGSGDKEKQSGKIGGGSGDGEQKSGKIGGGGQGTAGGASSSSDIYNLGNGFYKGPKEESHGLGWDPFYEDDYKPKYTPAENFKGKYNVAGMGVVTPQVLADSLVKKGVASNRVSAALQGFNKMGANGVSIGTVRDQDTCGGCWAFAATQSLWSMRSTYSSNRANIVQSSPQQAIDCVETLNSKGCDGGLPQDVFDYFATYEAVSVDAYPVNIPGKKGECIDMYFFKHKKNPYTGLPANLGIISAGWQHAIPECTTAQCTEQAAKEVELFEFMQRTKLPVIIWVDATNWKDFSGGLFPVSACSSSMEAGNHIVEIIGWGTDTNTPKGNPTYPNSPNPTGLPYWIVKNSWGYKWGEMGTVRLPMGFNACGLANYPITAKIKA